MINLDTFGLVISIIWGLFWGVGVAYLAYKELKIETDKGFSPIRLLVSIIAFIVVGGLSGTFAYLYLNI